MTNEQILKPEVEILEPKQDFYIPVELWNNNYFYIGSSYKTKEEAMHSVSTKEGPVRIIKITLNIEDFN